MASTSKASGEPVRIKNNYEVNHSLDESETELIKIKYNTMLHEHFLATRNSKDPSLLSQNCINSLIMNVKREEEQSSLNCNYINIYEDQYTFVQSVGGPEKLLKKDYDGKYKIFLPWENIFDIFWKTHIKNSHPSTTALRSILQNDYVVDDFAIQNINEVCNICSVANKPYFRCSLDIIPMIPNLRLTSIMICQDMHTGFMHLRPLSDDNQESEICMELLKIFMDFGPPRVVYISSDTFEIALDQFQNLTTFANIPIKVIKVDPDYDKFNQLRVKILRWINDNNFDNNWSIGCCGAQWHMNNENVRSDQKSPFASIFKSLPSFVAGDLHCSQLPSSNEPRIDKAVSTMSPIGFDAHELISVRAIAEPAVSVMSSVDDIAHLEEPLDNENAITRVSPKDLFTPELICVRSIAEPAASAISPIEEIEHLEEEVNSETALSTVSPMDLYTPELISVTSITEPSTSAMSPVDEIEQLEEQLNNEMVAVMETANISFSMSEIEDKDPLDIDETIL